MSATLRFNLVLIVFFSLFSISAMASKASDSIIYNGKTLTKTDLNELYAQIKPGTVLILGEMHGLLSVRNQQMQIINAVKQQHVNFSVGLEFLNYTDQSSIDLYRLGQLPETDFLKAVKWGGFDFTLYRDQLLSPNENNFSLGINLSRDITKIIAQKGIAALSSEQQKQLPPQFTVGRQSYRERFFQAMGHPVPVESLENYFVAQSAWDDTMAWQTIEFLKKDPNAIFIIIVGEFHVQYGGGLPHRIAERMKLADLNHQIITVSQINSDDLLNEQQMQDSMVIDEVDGPRADFILFSTNAL